MGWFLFCSVVISFSFVLCLVFLLLLPYLYRQTSAQDCLVSVVPVMKNDDELELTVHELMQQGRWNKRIKRLHILLLNRDVQTSGDDTVQLCRCLCKRWENIVFYCDSFNSAETMLRELLIAKEDEV